jgi:hypothetical protein
MVVNLVITKYIALCLKSMLFCTDERAVLIEVSVYVGASKYLNIYPEMVLCIMPHAALIHPVYCTLTRATDIHSVVIFILSKYRMRDTQ